MSRVDRLTALMRRFTLSVHPAGPESATLAVCADDAGTPRAVLFRAQECGFDIPDNQVLFLAAVDWGGRANPLMAALPGIVELDISADPDSAALVALMKTELAARRCGSESAVSRLAEVLIIRLLRSRIEAGSTRPGLLAGLSDPRLSRAIVAIHDRPDKDWRTADLAGIAGLSVSRFAETFRAGMGETPGSYLRRWRMTLARQDIARGDRIDAVSRRYGYDSPEGFARAFKRHFGDTPVALRKEAA